MEKSSVENLSGIFSVVPFENPIQRALKINGGEPEYIFPEYQNSRSQDMKTYYYDAGQFYFCSIPSLLHNQSFVNNDNGVFILPITEAQDIDVESDWKIAELKFKGQM